jgi:hypothetical protein
MAGLGDTPTVSAEELRDAAAALVVETERRTSPVLITGEADG